MSKRNGDGLKYYINFPDSEGQGQHSSQYDNEDGYVFVADVGKLPVILLLGWAGCEDKHLAKYSKIYEDKGLITLRYTAPVEYVFWKRHQMITIGQKLVRLLLDLNFETHPVIVHCFSNGGSFTYQNFSTALENSPKSIQVKGVIFDSAPGQPRIFTLYKVISSIFGGNFLYKFSLFFLCTMLYSTIWIYDTINTYINPKKYLQRDPFNALKYEKNMWSQHFIYSKADDLIPHSDVEQFAGHREEMGVEVSTLCFNDSPHVKHISHYHDSYVTSVYDFINKCLNSL